MVIGQKLKAARLNAGLTQETVAEAIQVSRQTISNWENQRSYPDIVSVIRLSELYDISLDALLKGDDAMVEHLAASTNTVKSHRRLSALGALTLVVVLVVNLLLGDPGSTLLWLSLLLEVGILWILDLSALPRKGPRTVGLFLRILCVVLYLGILALCGLAALDAFQAGNWETAGKLAMTALLVGVCTYFLFLRNLMRHK